jgi:cation diffusion facilitator family transporter
MHAENITHLECPRDFGDVPEARERGARAVVMLSAAMMVAELAVGYWTHSLALIADGWHMATHAGALGLTAVAYWFARSRARDRTFCFGTGKVHALAGYTSAIVLMIVALSMSAQSALRFIEPAVVGYREALPVAILGLIVNLASLKLLGQGHDHDHDHDGGHGDTDHNHRAALVHVVADALTSVLAIVSLALGAAFDWRFLDPLMGLVGGMVVMKWGVSLCRAAGRQLLDATVSKQLARRIQSLLEELDDVRVTDLHVWEVGPGRHACIATVITSIARDTVHYRTPILAACPIAHLTIEVHRCREGHATAT